MPWRDGCELGVDGSAHFGSLAELDIWAASPSAKLRGILRYHERHPVHSSELGDWGNLLVCHDYKGGYTETPFALSYTFNYWSSVDTFVYFSHHRVTTPPPGWITAAHRQGVKILGTLIFEHAAEEDCLRLLVGKLSQSVTGPALPTSRQSIPLSPHYARLLANLAHERGFDGYLLNFECPLQGGVEQTKALAAWISLLQSELRNVVGSYAQTIWYDSVIFTGHLRWQDRLNSLNLPFFLPSTAFFTNYTWPPDYPILNAQYFLSLDPALIGGDTDGGLLSNSKSLHDIFVGVDVWGRGSHGGGGFGSYKAIEHIDPKSTGLSVALFGQAWTWESEQDKPGWTWERWWDYERKLWTGSKTEIIHVPDAPRREGESECPHGPFFSISSFFLKKHPPNPLSLAFHTTFCPGVGWSWFVDGRKAFSTVNGWTDIDKQCSMGDLVWPSPSLTWEGEEWVDDLPDASAGICLDDSWNGGSSLRLGISSPGFNDEDSFFRCIWLPVQSLAITARQHYEARAVYKIESSVQVDLDLGLSVKVLSGPDGHDIHVTNTISHSDLPNGWTRLTIQFSLAVDLSVPLDTSLDSSVAIGLVAGIAPEQPTQSFNFSILLGQLNVFPCPPKKATTHTPMIIWADFQPSHSDSSDGRINGVLTWDTAVTLAPLNAINDVSPEDPVPVWTLDMSDRWFPAYLYFNIYAQAHGYVGGPDDGLWIGTTGLDGRDNRFVVNMPVPPRANGVKDTKGVRFYIQGINDHGEVLLWNQCVFIDIQV